MKIEIKKTCSLSRFEYALASPVKKRQQALRKSVHAYGSGYVIKKLVVLRTYRKGSSAFERQYDILDQDIRYVQRYRDAMSDVARKKDLRQYRKHAQLKNSEKVYC